MIRKSSGASVISRAEFIGRVCVLGVSFVFAGASQAATTAGTTFYWTGGGGDWSEVANWSMDAKGTVAAERYPGQDESVVNDVAQFVDSASGTVNVDKEVTLYRFVVDSSKTHPTMTMSGTGKITTSKDAGNTADERSGMKRAVTFATRYEGKYLDCYGNVTFAEGADVTCTSVLYLWSNSHTTFEPGSKFTISGRIGLDRQSDVVTLTIRGGDITAGTIRLDRSHARVEIFGGKIKAGLDYHSDATTDCGIVIGGGTLDAGGTFNVPDFCDWTFTNGTVMTSKRITDRRFLGTADAVFLERLDSFTAVNVLTEAEPTYDFNATLYATNGQYTGFAITNEAVLGGTGTMYLSRLYFEAPASDSVARYGKDLKFNIGTGVTFNSSGVFDFSDGANFGSFGNWSVNCRKSNGKINLGGTVNIDTTDVFDGATPHTNTLSKLNAVKECALNVNGCGLANVTFSSVSVPFGGVSVGKDASLKLSVPAAETKALALADGGTLELASPNLQVESTNIQVAATAKVVVNLPVDLKYDKYPLFDAYAPEGGNDFSSSVTLTGDGAADYSIQNVLGFTYITKGIEPEYGDIGTSNIWTGAVNGDWHEAGNWLSKKVPPRVNSSSSDANVFFSGTRNTVVTNVHEFEDWGCNRLVFLDNCGPFVLRGDKLRVCANGYRNPASSPVVSFSRFPALIENDLYALSALSACAAGKSYLQFNGAVSVKNLYRPAGDVRIGGSLTAKGFLPESTITGGRTTKVGVLDGGSMIITAQYTNLVNTTATLDIAKGGTVEFQNGSGAYFGSNVSQMNHVVDGLLDVQCPMGVKETIGFRGSGEIRIASVASCDDPNWAGKSAEFQFSGGMTVKPAEWNTTDDVQPTSSTRLHAVGDVTLSVTGRCWYGPKPGVETQTVAADRAMLIDAGATLTLTAADGALVLADPICGAGTLRFADGVVLEPAGALAVPGVWTEIARVGAVEGLPVCETFRFKTVENDDGTVSLLAKPFAGALIILR